MLAAPFKALVNVLNPIPEANKPAAMAPSAMPDAARSKQILTLAPELDEEAGHEAYHARWSHEFHRRHLTHEELIGVEEFLSKTDSKSVWYETKTSPEVTAAESLGEVKANNLANRKFNQRLWELVPDELKQAFVYRAYTAGIEEVLIPLMEIQDNHPRNYQKNFAEIPKMYGNQPGLLLISEAQFSKIVDLVKSNSDLTEVIEELKQMQTLEAYEHFIIGFYEEMVAEKEKIIQEMQETF